MPSSLNDLDNAALFERAQRVIPGGVNSPVRAFGPVGGRPPFMRRGTGPYLEDHNGRRYIDYVGSWGPLILGHAAEFVQEAIREALASGTSFGAPTAREVELAELLTRRVPGAEMSRLVSSGTEATMTALRLARGITGRDEFIKFEGCYHGHSDSFLVAAGSGAASHGHPSSPGVPEALAALTRTAPFNDLAAVEAHFEQSPEGIAAVFVEPIAGNMGCVPPVPGFLEGLRDLCTKFGALLVFDEVMTGFRVHPQGAQGLTGVTADLVTLGKIVGGGMPLGAVAGPAKLMGQLSPTGPIYQAGTLSGNPLSVAAGLATLRELENREAEIYGHLNHVTERLLAGMGQIFSDKGVPHTLVQRGSMFGMFFREGPVTNFAEASAADLERFKRYFHGLLERGVYMAPSPFEAGFVSFDHSESVIDTTLEAIADLEL